MAIEYDQDAVALRSQAFDLKLKGFANRMYKFKQIVSVVPTSAWINFYYREQNTPMADTVGNTGTGIPRGAQFPQGVVLNDKVKSTIVKFGKETNIHWESILTDDIDVQDRAIFKLSEAVTKYVDDHIWDVLTESRIPVNIATVSMSVAFNGNNAEWNSTSASIVDNILQGKQIISQNNYDTGDLVLLVNPRDYRSIIKWVTDKGAQWSAPSATAMLKGEQPGIAGARIIVSRSVTASCALLVKPKVCATWRELVSLRSTTKEDPYVSVTCRAVEEGICQLTDPGSVVLFQGTEHNPGTAHP